MVQVEGLSGYGESTQVGKHWVKYSYERDRRFVSPSTQMALHDIVRQSSNNLAMKLSGTSAYTSAQVDVGLWTLLGLYTL